MKKTIGIIGGMGPLATCCLYRSIIEHTDAAGDGEHLHVIIDSNDDIPDRSAALLNGGADPVPAILRSAQRLENAGAQLLAMPCNTSHCFAERITPAMRVPFINMVDETVNELQKRGCRKAGLLATDGTVFAGVYDKALAASGIRCVVPPPELQREVMGVIYLGVKAGNRDYDPSGFQRAVNRLLSEGADTLLLACTELAPAFEIYKMGNKNCLDATDALAKALVREAGGRLK